MVAPKIQLCASESDERTPKKGNEHDESERNTRSRSFMRRYRYCTIDRFAAEGLIFS